MKVLGRVITLPKDIRLMPKGILAAIAIVIVLICVFVAVIFLPGKKDVQAYDYNETEQQLADTVINFISEHIQLSPEESAKIADTAVENYRIIINSDIDVVGDDHTEAIRQKIKGAIGENIHSVEITEDMLENLSLGIARIVWEMIYAQIETVTGSTNLESDYYYLADSIQKQIDKLEERTMQVSIQANIKNGTSGITAEELLSLIEGMTDEEIEALAESLGLSYDELYELLAAGNDGMGNNGMGKELEEKLQELKEKLEKELGDELKEELEKELGQDMSASDGKNGRGGRNGTDGRDGSDGQDGKDGKDGKAGRDGDSIYIRYSAEPNGRDMTDKPTSDTKYMGTYTGASASSNPTDYTWTRYSDATITYSGGTLYITQ